MATAQVARATSSAIASVLGEILQGSKKVASLEKTKKELAEEVKKRKTLEMKVDMIFQ
jgi:hypothetical protein